MVDGVEVSVMGCFINNCQCQPMHPSLVLEGQSCVYHSRCILASSISLSVLACLAKCGHCVRRSESGMALVMMPLQSIHLTHACMYTTLCAMSHHVSFLFLNGGWNSVPSRNGCCVLGVNAFTVSLCLCTHKPLSSINSHHSMTACCHCDCDGSLASVCW